MANLRWVGAAAIAVLLFLTGCSSAVNVDPQGQPVEAAAEPEGVPAEQPSQSQPAGNPLQPDQAVASIDPAAADGETDDRGLRVVGPEPVIVSGSQPQSDTPPSTDAEVVAGDEPVAPAEPAVSEPVPAEPEAEQPAADPAPAAVPEPTAPPAPTPTPQVFFDPVQPEGSSVFDGPVPSDELEIQQGAPIDDALPPTISDGGARACATAESAILFLDAGDLTRMQDTLVEASVHAGTAAEAEIRAVGPALANVERDTDAGFDVIVQALNACAIHGYEV